MLSHGLIPVAEAARQLDVHPSRVRAMLSDGQLAGEKLGGRWLIAASSVHDRERLPHARGRPLDPENAWAVLRLSSGESPDSAAPNNARRIVASLEEHGLGGLAPRLRRRADVQRFYAHPGVLRRLAESPALVLSGANGAPHYRLGLVPGDEIDAYIAEGLLPRIIKEMALEPRSEGGNVVLRVLPDGVSPLPGPVAPIVAVALDLAEQADPRSARVGKEALQRLARESRWRMGAVA